MEENKQNSKKEKKEITSNENRPKRKLNKTIVLVVLLIIALILGPLLGAGGVYYATKDSATPSDASDKVAEEAVDEEEDCEECEECEECVEPEYSASIGGKDVTFLDGWYISSVNLTVESDPTIVKDELPLLYESAWIDTVDTYEYVLSNGESELSFTYNGVIIMGPFGVVPSGLEVGYDVVVEPTPTTIGLARKLVSGDYTYVIVGYCEEADMCGDYLVTDSPFPETIIFSGVEEDMLDAEEIILELVELEVIKLY